MGANLLGAEGGLRDAGEAQPPQSSDHVAWSDMGEFGQPGGGKGDIDP